MTQNEIGMLPSQPACRFFGWIGREIRCAICLSCSRGPAGRVRASHIEAATMGWPGLEPGTNPEIFRGCSGKWRTARLELRVADSSSVLDCARSCVLRPLMELPAPRQVQFGLRTDALCGCRHVYDRTYDVQDCR